MKEGILLALPHRIKAHISTQNVSQEAPFSRISRTLLKKVQQRFHQSKQKHRNLTYRIAFPRSTNKSTRKATRLLCWPKKQLPLKIFKDYRKTTQSSAIFFKYTKKYQKDSNHSSSAYKNLMSISQIISKLSNKKVGSLR